MHFLYSSFPSKKSAALPLLKKCVSNLCLFPQFLFLFSIRGICRDGHKTGPAPFCLWVYVGGLHPSWVGFQLHLFLSKFGFGA